MGFIRAQKNRFVDKKVGLVEKFNTAIEMFCLNCYFKSATEQYNFL